MKPSSLTILEAIERPELFRPFFKPGLIRGDSWQPWRAFLGSLFGLPLSPDHFDIYKKHTGRSSPPTSQFSECYCIIGRRGGKSRIAALVAVFLACFRDYSDLLAPGERGIIQIVAADRRQAKVILGYVNGFFDSVPFLSRMISNRLKESIELRNNVTIEVQTCSFKSVRGFTVIGMIADELAYWRDEDSANPAEEVLAAVRPAMTTIPNALLLGISSAYIRSGPLYDNYKQHFGKDDSDVLVWKASSVEMNPSLTLPRIWDHVRGRSEYGSEFRDPTSSLFSMPILEQLTIPGRLELAPRQGIQYVAFADPSGGASDSFTVGIAHRDGERAILDCIREIKPPFSPALVVSEYCTLLKSYRCHEVHGDRYAAEWVAEMFAKNGVTYRASELTRSEIYVAMLAAVMSNGVELLENKTLLNQLAGLERTARIGGRESIDHPSGSHDDVANAASGAITLLTAGQHTVRLTWWEYLIENQSRDEKPALVIPPSEPTENMSVIRHHAQVAAETAGVVCPECGGSDCIVKRGKRYVHNVCGHDWPIQTPEEAPVGGRHRALEEYDRSRPSGWPRTR